MNDFKIKNLEFLLCLEKINRVEELELYKFLEKLIYDEISKPKIETYKSKLNSLGVENFIKNIREEIYKKTSQKDLKLKRKNIKESMLENYVIKNQKSQEFLKELNLKILLKIIPNKNIIVEDGDIVDIIL